MSLRVKKLCVSGILLLFYISSSSQVRYDPGYFISNTGDTINCLIKNTDHNDNPSSFTYKKNENDKPQTLTVYDVKEFAITNYNKYVRVITTIDISPGEEDLDALSDTAEPQWQPDTLFLRVIVTGAATLFSYEGKTNIRFFYQTQDLPVEQLIYKVYRPENNNVIYYNNDFREQLLQYLNCGNESEENIQTVEYKLSDLKDYFIKYNHCKGSIVTEPSAPVKYKSSFFSISAGAEYTSLEDGFIPNYPGDPYTQHITFPHKYNFTFGVQEELLLPFNAHKWAVPFGLDFHSYSAQAISDLPPPNNSIDTPKATINLKTISISIGFKHYFFTDKYGKSKLFVNALVAYDQLINSSYTSTLGLNVLSSSTIFIGGIGYKYNKAAIEFRYYTPANIFNSYVLFTSSLTRFSTVFKYDLF